MPGPEEEDEVKEELGRPQPPDLWLCDRSIFSVGFHSILSGRSMVDSIHTCTMYQYSVIVLVETRRRDFLRRFRKGSEIRFRPPITH